MKKIIFVLISSFFILSFSFGQNKWAINYANQYLTNTLTKIEKSGYIIKKISLTNNQYIDLLTFDSPPTDTLFIIAATISPIDNKIILNPDELSLSVYGKLYLKSTKSVYDTLLIEDKQYDKKVDNKANKNIYSWHIAILPNQFESIKATQYSVSLDEDMRIGSIDSKDLPKGNTAEEREKNSDHKQLFIVLYSKS